jgi:hypothetical protein
MSFSQPNKEKQPMSDPDAPKPEQPIQQPPQVTPPIYYPPTVTPPIYYPPVSVMPPIYQPPGIWGGGNVPMPTPPIYMPPVNVMPPIYSPIDPGYGVPGWPSHPIAWPRPPVDPGYGVPGYRPSHPIVLPPPSKPDIPMPDPATGYWVMSPGQPCMWVVADSEDAAASNYANSMNLTVGENLVVFTDSTAYVVEVTSDIGVSPA